MKRIFIYAILLLASVAAHGEVYRWAYDLTFEAPEGGRVVYNTPKRLEMLWGDMTLIVNVYGSRGVTDEVMKQNLQRTASEYYMYDTKTKKYSRNGLSGFCLEGILPDGSNANIYNMLSKKSGRCIQLIVNFTRDSEKAAKKLVKTFKEQPAKEPKKKKPIKQRIQKKDAPLKPIKKRTPVGELYEA